MDTTTLLTRSGDGSRDGQSNTTRSGEALCHRSMLTLPAWSYQRLQLFDMTHVQCFSSQLCFLPNVSAAKQNVLKKQFCCLNNIKVQFLQHQVGAWFSFSDPAKNHQTNRLTPLCWFPSTILILIMVWQFNIFKNASELPTKEDDGSCLQHMSLLIKVREAELANNGL